VQPHRYNWIHALVATIVLVAAVSKDFWHNFLHGGFSSPPAPRLVLVMLGLQAALFGSLLLVLWVSTLFAKCPAESANNAPKALKALKFAAWTFVPIALGAFALEWLSMTVLEHVFQLQPAAQDLVKWFQPGTYPTGLRFVLMGFVLFEAPLLEEPLFRGILFRGLWSAMPHWAATAISGFLFALVHVNAASFLPLWFLGCAFAELYRRTGTILAPMTAHALFNAANLALLPFLPATS
jgi:membrane protease YdiL (CAAX protease family)